MKKKVTEKVADALIGVPLGKHKEEFLVEGKFDTDGVQVSSSIGLDGKEYPDPVPLEVPLARGSPGLDQLIRTYVTREISARAAASEFETFEEADDFEVDDDFEWMDEETPYEKVFEPPLDASKASEVAAAGPSQTEAPPAAGPLDGPNKVSTGSPRGDPSGVPSAGEAK